MWNSRQNRLILVISAVMIVALFVYALLRDTAQIVTLNKVQELISGEKIERVVASEEFYYIYSFEGKFKIAASQVTPTMFQNTPVEVDSGSGVAVGLLLIVIILALGTAALRWWQKRDTQGSQQGLGGTLQNASGHSQPISPVKSDVTFKDIGGVSDVKEELVEIIDFLRNPKRYRNFGARMPRGVLLVGPPGVGKTMIAKAVAAEAGVPFFYQSGASFVQIYVGMGAKRVHDLFAAAQANTPSIIFIDEIDAVGKKRDGNSNDEREATLNQLLTEMDGFQDSSGVIVVAATNKIEVLDEALLRAGRFDRRVFVELPTPKERESIISKYLQHIPHNVNSEEIAKMTVGFNGASLAALVNEAALLSLRSNDMQVTMTHFDQVKDKVMLGKKKIPVLSDEQKSYRARYQAGKAVVAQWFRIPFEKVTIVGDAFQNLDSGTLLKHELEARVKLLLAGMAACEIHFNEHGSNASCDIDEARALVIRMLDKYAMGDSLVSAENEKGETLDRLYGETRALLVSLEGIVAEVERGLLQNESVTKEEIEELVNKVL